MSARTRLAALLVAVVASVGAVAPSVASAAQRLPANKILLLQQGSALAEVISLNEIPLDWHTSANQAMAAVKQTSTLEALHRTYVLRCSCAHPFVVTPYVWRAVHPYWYIVFTYKGKIVADANVNKDGKVTGVWTGRQALASYAHGGWAGVLVGWYIWLPGCLLFALAFFDPRRIWRMATLDGLAILSFGVSYLLLGGAHLESAVWLAYPPLLYLLFRLLRAGFGRSRGSGRLAPLLSTRTLLIGLPVLLAARIVLSLIGQQEIDIGYESVIGAYRALHHLPLYYNDQFHGDTYGPITYLAYIPFELIWPWKNSLSSLDAANYAAIFWDLGTLVGLVLLGRQLRPGAEGKRLGLVLAWAWAACPFTTVALIVHTNDGLVSMLTVFALVATTRPVVSGALLGLATAAKFSPGALVPLLAAPRQRGWKGAIALVGTAAVVVVVAIVAWLPPGGFSYFWNRTIHYQMVRLDVFSPWALHPTLHPIQVVLEVLAVLLILAVAFVPRERSLARTCALAGAVTLAIQLPATHWYYYYIEWFLPFALVAFLCRSATQTAAVSVPSASASHGTESTPGTPALAGA